MKYVSVLLALLLVFAGLTACTAPGGKDPSAADPARTKLADFTAQMANGDTFTLSEALGENKPVLINLWATWCPYCIREFPYLQAVYEKNKENLTVAVLSVEETDTQQVISDFAAENGYTFPMGSALGTGLERYAQGGIPVTIVVDREGYVAAVKTGMAQSEEEIQNMVQEYLSADYAPKETCVFQIYCIDMDSRGLLPGCTLSFCTDEVCVPVSLPQGSLENYEMPAAAYTVKLVSCPEGYVLEEGCSPELEVGPYDQNIEFYFVKE